MKIPATFLRSRVGRRIVFLFVSCALLPVMVLAVITVYQVSSQFRKESGMQLARSSKQQGMEIYARLSMLDSDLQIFSIQVNERRARKAGRILGEEFHGIATFSVDGKALSHWGAPAPAPGPFTPQEQQHLDSGQSLLLVKGCEGQDVCLYLVRAAQNPSPREAIVVGNVNPQYVWAVHMASPELHVCVLSAARTVLFCSDESMKRAESLTLSGQAPGLFQWQSEGAAYDAASWKLLMRPTFLQEPWMVVVSQRHEEAIAPIVRFRRDFVLVIVLALWIVLFFSLVQVRRTLGPLRQLREGTQKIGSGQFENRVEVHSSDEFEDLAASFNTMAARLGRQFHTLKTINEIDHAIFASLDREGIVDGVLGHMKKLIPCDCFAVCVLDESRSGGRVRFRSSDRGFVRTEDTGISESDWLRFQTEPLGFTVDGDDDVPEYLGPLRAIGMRSFLVLPIRFENSIQGALVCAQVNPGGLTLQEMQEARQVADQLAVALSHVHLIQALEQLQWGTLTALARAIDAKSKWTAGHSERVTTLALEIGRTMGLSGNDLRILQTGGLLHDIGKIGTPPEVLDKPGKLTADEFRIMKEHVSTGVRILEPVGGFRDALPIVAQHHEWFDGSGYPAGVAGQDISLYARILSVADCYDALTSDRPYRKGLPVAQTIAMLQERSRSQFDPDVIEVFTRVVEAKGTQALAMAARVAP